MPTGRKAPTKSPTFLKEPRFVAGVVFLLLMVLSAHIKLETPIDSLSFSLQTIVLGLTCRVLKPLDAFKVVLIYILLGAVGLDVFSAVTEGPHFYTHRYAGFLMGFLICPLYFHYMRRVSNKCLQDLFFVFLGMHAILLMAGIIRMEYPGYNSSAVTTVITTLAPAAILKSVLLALILRILTAIPAWKTVKLKLDR